MAPWQYQIPLGHLLLDLSLLGVLLLLATLMRRYIPFLQKMLIPNNIVAGLMALILGGLIPDLVSTDRMGTYVYHLLGLTFIAVAMSKPRASAGLGPVHTGMLFIATYLVQGIAGMVITFGLMATVMPDLFPGFGLLIPLGYGMGPGIAYTIAQNWEASGFVDGGSVGLSMAAMGFAFAYIHGIYWMRKGIRDGLSATIRDADDLPPELKTGLMGTNSRPVVGFQTTASEAVETFTMHWSLIGLVYGVAWLVLVGLSEVLTSVGAESELNTLWSFHFIACSVIGIFTRQLVDRFDMGHHIDEGIMTHTGNLFVDIMITASLAGISVAVVGAYWLPLLLCGLVGGYLTYLFIREMSKRIFKDWLFERTLSAYAVMTGTIQSGLVLLRVLDPAYKSPISIDLVYASGFALVFGFPLLFLINAPMTLFDDPLTGFVYSFVGLVIYAFVIAAAWVALHRFGKR